VHDLDLLIDLHLRNDRLAPGGDAETRRALELTGLDPSAPLEVADVGCGTGASTLILAGELKSRVTAIDAAAPFVQRLEERAARAGLANRISAQVGQMEALPFHESQLDLLWSEGAIYNIGFARGLRAWRPFLRPGGVIAVSELTWTTAKRPSDIEQHWVSEYPGIATASSNLATLEQEGYRPLAMFFLPPRCWVENYYAPLRSGFDSFLERHEHSDAAVRMIRAEQSEIRLYEEQGAWYGYAFYIASKVNT